MFFSILQEVNEENQFAFMPHDTVCCQFKEFYYRDMLNIVATF